MRETTPPGVPASPVGPVGTTGDQAARGGWPRPARRLARALGRGGAGRLAHQRSRIEVGDDWRRCGAGDGGCGVLLPLSQQTCPRCGRTNREDLAPLNVRRLLPTHDAYEHALAVLRGTPPGRDPTAGAAPDETPPAGAMAPADEAAREPAPGVPRSADRPGAPR